MISHKIIKYVPPVQQHTGTALVPRLLYTQEQLEDHIKSVGLKVGDYVYYNRNPHEPKPDSAALSLVVEIETDPLKVKSSYNHPKTFLLMQLTGTSRYCRDPEYKFSKTPWTRWDDGLGMVKLSEEWQKELLDDYVQDYVKEHQPNARKYIR